MKRAIKSAINLAFKGVARTAPVGKFVWNNIFAHPMRFLGVLNASNARRSQSSSSSNNTNTNYAIVGLGNPGKRFEGTRHNVGFEVIDYLSKNGGSKLLEKSCSSSSSLSSSSLRLQNNSSVNSEISDVVLAEYIVNDEEENEGDDDESKSPSSSTRVSRKIVLAKPQTFMNVSGTAVRKIMRKYRVPIENVLVVYDDLDTKVGQIRIKKSGSHGGHNGIRDILDIPRVKNAFPRVRVGIGRPENESVQVYEHVLSKFREEERGEIDKAVEKAAAAVVDILRFGVDDAIARQNGNVPKKKNKNKGGGDGTKKLKVKGGQPVAVAFKVSEDGEKVEVDIFARSSRKKEIVAVAAVEEADDVK
jgi:PTH1 family peptidyl-tRNA hydrolase